MWGVAYMGVAMYVGSDLYGSGCVCGEWPIWEWLSGEWPGGEWPGGE